MDCVYLKRKKGQLIHFFKEHTTVNHNLSLEQQTIKFSRNNRFLAVAYDKGSVWVWDCQTGQLKSSLWSMSRTSDKKVLWEVYDKDSITNSNEDRLKLEIESLLWLADNKTLLVGTKAGLYSWNFESDKCAFVCSGNIEGLGLWQNPADSEAYYLAVFDEKEAEIRVYNQTQAQIGIIRDIDECECGWLAFSRDGNLLQTIEYRYDWRKGEVIEGRDFVDLEKDMWWDGTSNTALAVAEKNHKGSVWINHYGLSENTFNTAQEEIPNITCEDVPGKKTENDDSAFIAARKKATELFRYIIQSYKTIYSDNLHELTSRIDELLVLSKQFSDRKILHFYYFSGLCKLVNTLVEFGLIKDAKTHFAIIQEIAKVNMEDSDYVREYSEILGDFARYYFRDKRETSAQEFLDQYFEIFKKYQEESIQSKYIDCVKWIAFNFIERELHDDAAKHLDKIYDYIINTKDDELRILFAENLHKICESYQRRSYIDKIIFYAIRMGTLVKWEDNKHINFQYIEMIRYLAPHIFEQSEIIREDTGHNRELYTYTLDHMRLVYDYYFYDEFIEKIRIEDTKDQLTHARFYYLLNDCLMAAFECKEIEEGIRVADKIQKIAHVNNHTYHSAACLYVAGGLYEKALEQLELSKKYKYPFMDRIRTDEDLRPLFEDPRFKALFTN